MFIVLEGIDGCGKTTVAKLLAEKCNALVTKEPTAGSKKIHQILRHHVTAPSPLEMQELYIADRLEHIKRVIEPALAKGKNVICQRYALSTYAYGTAFGVSQKDLKHDFLEPDATFLLDLSAKDAIKRIEKRKKTKEYFEKEKKLEKIRKQYLKLAKQHKAIIIDAMPSPEVIVEEILMHLKLV